MTAVSRSDLNRARSLLDRFNESQTPRGGNDAMFLAVRSIAQAGSSPGSVTHARSSAEFARKLAEWPRIEGDLGLDEPWLWLAAVAEGAERFGDHHLLASVAFFTCNWHGFVSPRIEEEDEYEMRLLRYVPPEVRVRVFRAARRGLADADPRHILIKDPKGGPGGPFTICQMVGSMVFNIRRDIADYPSDLRSFARDFAP